VSCAWDGAAGTDCTGGVETVSGLPPGAHTLTITATDEGGNATTVVRHLTYAPPTAKFTASTTKATVGAPVTFDASASSSAAGITSYQWDLGDNTTATGRQVTHTYSSTGTFTPKLTVTDAQGGTATYFGAPVTVKLASALAFASQPTLRYGASRTLTTTLRVAGSPAGGRTVTLLAEPAGATSFKAVGTATTSSSGVARIAVTPHVTTAYKWSYAGNDATFGARSVTRTMHVAFAVSAYLTKAHIAVGKTTTVWGTVAPSAAGQHVVVQRKAGTKWVTVATVTLSKQRLPSGQRTVGFVYTYKGAKAGTVTLRVVRAATAKLSQGVSATRTLTVG
jgi:PKD repeat protein